MRNAKCKNGRCAWDWSAVAAQWCAAFYYCVWLPLGLIGRALFGLNDAMY
jgi:hypothetical protein